MRLTLEDVLALEHVQMYNVEALETQRVVHVSTDSRTTKRGDVFFALRGEKFDGREFVGKAFENGAVLAVIDEWKDVSSWAGKALIVVKDTIKALGTSALRHRKKFDFPFIAVAGSNGKTTTKDMIAAVLEKKYTVLKTEGNLNNHIGVPHTLFRLEKKHDIAVVEIGTNHFGELSYLCGILEPTYGVITNIAREHLAFFEDLRGVAKAEGELFVSLAKSSGVGFVNVIDPWIVRAAKKMKRKISYGVTTHNVHVKGKFLGMNGHACAALSVKLRGKREFNIQLSTPGRHAISNALAAAVVGLTFKVPPREIQRALETFTPSSKRMDIRIAGGVTILDDTYNANPDSTLAALETLQAMSCSGKKIIVLADMLELGDKSEEEHRRIGAAVGKVGDYLLTCGPLAKFIYDEAAIDMKFHYDQKNVLSEYLSELVSPGDIVLVKGSRVMRMEDVVTFLVERLSSKRRAVASLAG